MKSFLRRDDGVASVEFALMFPIVISIFLISAEMGIVQMRQAMLERATDIVVRQLRLGRPEFRDPLVLKSAVCAEAMLIVDCEANMQLEMGPVNPRTFLYWAGAGQCVDRTQTANPVVNYTSGARNETMLLRFCVLHDPIFPTIGLGKLLPEVLGGGYKMMATTFFVNEPA